MKLPIEGVAPVGVGPCRGNPLWLPNVLWDITFQFDTVTWQRECLTLWATIRDCPYGVRVALTDQMPLV